MDTLTALFGRLWLLSLCTVLALSGCGGGGGGGSAGGSGSTPSTETPAAAPVALNRALLGPLAGSQIRAYLLSDRSTPIEGPLTTDSAHNLNTAGSFSLRLNGVADDTWVLVTASGGSDIDSDDNGVLDASSLSNLGQVHAIARAAQWRQGGTNITLLSDIAWRYAQDVLNDSEALATRLDAVADNLLRQDLTNDGVINHEDVAAFVPVNHKAQTRQDYTALLPDDDPATTTLVELIYADATDAAKNESFESQIDATDWTNLDPSANAGNDGMVDEQTLVTLAGQADDSDGTVVAARWQQLSGPAVILADANSAISHFTAPSVTAPTVLVFELTVEDNQGATASDRISITVQAVNALPVAEAGHDQSVNEQSTVELSGSATDADGHLVGYRWSQVSGPAVILSAPDSLSTGFTAPALAYPTVLQFQLTVTDNEGGTASDTVAVTVLPVNAWPHVDAGADQSVNEQTVVQLSGTGSDSDGSITAYAWSQIAGPPVTLSHAHTATSRFTAPTLTSSTQLQFRLTVTDNEGASSSDTVRITVHPVNTPPVADAGSDQTVAEQSRVTLTSLSSDTDGSIVAYAWGQRGGTSVSLINANSVSANFIAPTLTAATTLLFELQVTDNEGASATDTVTITVNPVNTPPTATAGVDQYADGNTLVTLSGSGDDPDGTVEGYSWYQLSGPSVSLHNAATPHASFTAPALASSTALQFLLTVTDNEGAQGSDLVTITVNPITLSITGTIQAAAASYTDGDVNNPQAAYRNNDAPETAQALPTPATLGGFASAFGTGFAGDRFATSADPYDTYEVYLEAGQSVSLTIADSDPLSPWFGDLDLYLYASNDPTTPLAGSVSTTATESVQAPYTGTFHVLVHAFYGYSNYLLTVGPGAATASTEVRQFSADDEGFVAGELILQLNEDDSYDPRQTAQQQLQRVQERLSGLGISRKAGGPGRPLLINLGDAKQRQQTLGKLNPRRHTASAPRWGYGTQQSKVDTLQLLKTLEQQADVEAAGLNYLRHPQAVPTDPYYHLQWHYPQINLPQAWDLSTGNNVIVAVVDTGVVMAHPDLAPNLTDSGYDFIAATSISNDGDGIDANPDDPGDNNASFHGTHVAGTIAAASNNGVLVSGVAWDARIMPVRVLGWGGGTDYDVMQGVRYAAGLSNDSGTVPSARADIINLSLGGAGYSQTFQNTITEARTAGVIVVAAAGNSATSSPSYPAAYDGVVSVSATRYDNSKAYYSNYGTTIDVAAPGGDLTVDQNADYNGDGVLSTLVDGSRQPIASYYQGTSMAAPHVAGVAALMKSVHPQLTPAEFDAAISTGRITQDLGNDGAAVRNDNYGYGLIDGYKAVLHAGELAGGTPQPAVIAANPSALAFATAVSSQSFSLANGGGGTLHITGVTADAGWLSVTPSSVDADNLGTYTASVDRTGLSDGSYTATLTVTAEGVAALAVPVTLQVGPANSAPSDVGYQWVLLLDASTQQTVQEVGVNASEGTYTYTFNNVTPGSYYIVAGSDADNDYLICDAGESCGAYPSAAAATRLEVTNDMTDIDFSSGYGETFTPAATTSADQRGVRRQGEPVR